VALGLGEDNARFLLLFFVMLLYILAGAGLFSLLEHDNEKMQRKAYRSAVQQFLDNHPSVNKSDLDSLLEQHSEAASAGFLDDTRTRWDFSGSFYFVSTVVSTIGELIALDLAVKIWKNQSLFFLCICKGKLTRNRDYSLASCICTQKAVITS